MHLFIFILGFASGVLSVTAWAVHVATVKDEEQRRKIDIDHYGGNMIDEKKRELLKKLQTLAERGVGGEKVGAQMKLEQLMKKYGVEETDLSEEKEKGYVFRYHDDFEKQILWQLFYKIVPDFESRTYCHAHGRGSKTEFIIYCTKAQELQIRIEYDFYRDLWKEEVNFFLKAFVQKHQIFGETTSKGDACTTSMSQEDIFRMVQMMEGMKNKSIQPMLEIKN